MHGVKKKRKLPLDENRSHENVNCHTCKKGVQNSNPFIFLLPLQIERTWAKFVVGSSSAPRGFPPGQYYYCIQ